MLCPGEELGSSGAVCAKGKYIELTGPNDALMSMEW